MVSSARAERLVNLVLCLLSSRQYLTADRIRGIVPGYATAPSSEAFFRMFERDKAELRDLGIPVETGRNSVFDNTEGYRITRPDYELGEIDLEADEAAAVGLAVRLWESPEFSQAAHGALLKLRAAGVELDLSVGAAVEPKVRIAEPAFDALRAAVENGQVVTFRHRRSSEPEPDARLRTVEPWGVVSWRGRWYLVGHDRDRGATRCFRLSRIVGAVRAVGEPGAVHRPSDADLLRIVAGSADPAPAPEPAVLWIAADRAHGLRRHATTVGGREVGGTPGDVVEIEFRSLSSAADWIAGYAPDVLVIEPAGLADAVAAVLGGIVEETR